MGQDGTPSAQQHVVRRSVLFVYFPILIIAVLLANFVWEVVRANAGPVARSSGPLSFVLLDLSPTAGLLGAFGGFYLARLQWAKANQPAIGYSIVDDDGKFLRTSSKWMVQVNNAGPGHALVDEFQYIVQFAGQPRSVPASVDEITEALESKGLVDGTDFFIRMYGKGATLPPTNTADTGLVCWFTIAALAEIKEFEILLRIRDRLGDEHQRRLLITESLPSVAKKARDEFMLKRGTP